MAAYRLIGVSAAICGNDSPGGPPLSLGKAWKISVYMSVRRKEAVCRKLRHTGFFALFMLICKMWRYIKSAKKRVITSQKRADRNKAIRSKTKTAIKKVYAAIDAGDQAAAKEALRLATVELDKAQTKGVYHKNMTSRKVSRLSKAVNKMA